MGHIEVLGERFEVWPDISAWALADFAEAQKTAASSEEVSSDTILAMMKLIEDCIVPSDWERFKTHTRAKRASFDDLMEVVKAMTTQSAERPTGRPSDSSDGPKIIDQKSVSSSVDKVLEQFAGRPDLKLAIHKTREAQAS